MRRTLYAVLEHTREAAKDLRAAGLELEAGISDRLARFESAIEHALASSPDGETVAHAEEYVALDALCDLHVALQDQPGPLREQVRPIVDEWIAYAVSTGLTPQELASSAGKQGDAADEWLQALD